MKCCVVKRDGSSVEFDKSKIERAINKASLETELGIDEELSKVIATKVEKALKRNECINIEEIQDLVEELLMGSKRRDIAKRYILYRDKKNKIRKDGWEMTDLQRDILQNKYIFQNEGFNGFIERVGYKNPEIQKMMRDKKFLPAGRILMGRRLFEHGKRITYSNCFVLPSPEDNIESIFDTAKSMARTYSYGGGVGISLNKLRPKGAVVNNAAKETTGAVSFMELYSMTTGLISQKGRRGALIMALPVTHPDIIDFINIKTDLSKVNFANISIMITDDFMRTVEEDGMWHMEFVVKDTGETIRRKTKAKDLFRLIAKNNWNYAEPGFLFWDRVKSYHLNSEDPTFEYESTNPCGEKPLPAGGSCLLGSINLDTYVRGDSFTRDTTFDYESFSRGVRRAIRYLDDVLEEGIPLLPLQVQKDSVSKYRQIGLGTMGVADMFIRMATRYGSENSINLSDKIGSVMINMALQESALLAKERGAYPAYKKEYVLKSSFLKEVAWEETIAMIEEYGLRNAEVLSIAPTGSISSLIGVSGGIEPLFNISYTRESKTLSDEGSTFYKVFTPIAKEYMDKFGITDEKMLPDFFVTSATLDYRERVNFQAIWQKYVDAAISSTVNVPYEFTVEQVEDMYMYAWKKGLKGITLFRDGCARLGILTTESDKKAEDVEVEVKPVSKNPHDKFSCPECGGKMMNEAGCQTCLDCGYSPCSI